MRPDQGNWGSSEQKIIAEVRAFVHELLQKFTWNDTVIAVSSNGRLRYFLTLIEGEFENKKKQNNFKVKTGNICKLNFQPTGIHVDYWNQDPSTL